MDILETAEELERDGEWERALAVYRAARKAADSAADCNKLDLRIGICLFELSEFDAAEDQFANLTKSIDRLDDQMISGYIKLYQGKMQLELGHHRRALDRLNAARTILGDLPAIVAVLAKAHRERGEFDQAIALLEGYELDSLNAIDRMEILFELGSIYVDCGNYLLAEEILRQALDLHQVADTTHLTGACRLKMAQAILGTGGSRRTLARRLIEEAEEDFEDSSRGLSEVYGVLGQWYEGDGDLKQAARQYRRVRDLDRESDDVVGQARAERRLARIFRLQGDLDRSREALEAASKLLSGVDDDIEIAELCSEEGHLAIAEVDYDTAMIRFRKAADIARSDGNQRSMALSNRGIAIALRHDGQLEEAEALLREAIPVLREIGDLKELNDLLDELGQVLIDRNHYHEAIEVLEESLHIDEHVQATGSKGRSLLLLGLAHLRHGDRRVAGDYLRRSLALFTEAEDDGGRAGALLLVGDWESEEGQLTVALDHFREALRIQSRYENIVGIARAHRSIASIYLQRGDLDRAEECLNLALTELRDRDDPREDALLAVEMAKLKIEKAEWREAELQLLAASRQFDELKTPTEVAIVQRLQAKVFAVDPKTRHRALEYLNRAKDVFREFHNYPELDDLFDDLGVLYLELRRPAEAEEAVRESLKIGDKMGWTRGNGRSYLILAQIQLRQGRAKEAYRSIREAIDAYERAGDVIGQAKANILLGDWHASQGNLDEAIKAFKDARQIDRRFGDLRGISLSLRKLGEVYLRRNDFSRAEEAFDQAEDYMRSLHFVEDRSHLALARGRLFAQRGDHDQAIVEFQEALSGFDRQMMEDEKVRTYKELASSYHAIEEFGAAMDCMRQMGIEQAAIWGSLFDSFDEEIRLGVQAPYLRGEFASSVSNGYKVLESALQDRTRQLVEQGTRPATASELIDRWFTPEVRGSADLGERRLGQLRLLARSGFDLFRNSVAHSTNPVSGLDAFVGVAIAQYVYSHLDLPTHLQVERAEEVDEEREGKHHHSHEH